MVLTHTKQAKHANVANTAIMLNTFTCLGVIWITVLNQMTMLTTVDERENGSCNHSVRETKTKPLTGT